MEDYRSFIADDLADWDFPAADEPCMDLPPMIGTDERRMHVRAYEMWLSLLDGRDYPGIEDLDAEALGEFGPYSVLLDFSADRANPAIAYLGRALREEADLATDLGAVADVPERALLSRLTGHYAEILDNRAPVGFEAEFISHSSRALRASCSETSGNAPKESFFSRPNFLKRKRHSKEPVGCTKR